MVCSDKNRGVPVANQPFMGVEVNEYIWQPSLLSHRVLLFLS